jgi:KTSC domain
MNSRQVIPPPVASSLLASVAYDADHCILQLEFHSGAVYRYFDVPLSIYQQLMAADSKGSYFNHSIRGCFLHKFVLKAEPAHLPLPSSNKLSGIAL